MPQRTSASIHEPRGMGRRIICSIICLTVFFPKVFSQEDSSINNNTIKYSYRSTTTKIEVANSKNNTFPVEIILIQVQLAPEIRNRVLKFSYNEWMNLLGDKATDWAANLCLYDIYQKDAMNIELLSDKYRWARCCRSTDIAYWRTTLPR